MTWQNYPSIVIAVTVIWVLSNALLIPRFSKSFKVAGELLLILGALLLCSFIISYWHAIERPPFRTIAETRIWYGVFMSSIGIILYLRWKNGIILLLSLILALVFLWVNCFIPGDYEKELIPALQSPWFIPHVVVYMLGYAVMGLSFLVSLYGFLRKNQETKENLSKLVDNLVNIGFVFLTFGLMFGAIWAKIAWGHYWTWDPKETWALISWLIYLIYIHFNYKQSISPKTRFWILCIASIFVLICWLGVAYIPSAQSSVHVY